jgi:hypothetical protein
MRTKNVKSRARRAAALISALVAVTAMLAVVAPAAALGAPVLEVESSHDPPSVPAGTYAKYTLKVSNTGDEPTNGDVTLDFTVPAGLQVNSVKTLEFFGFSLWSCTIAGDSQSVSCAGMESTLGIPIMPGEEACENILGQTCRITVIVKADPGAPAGTATPEIEACGGGAAACFSAVDPIEIGPPPRFEVTSFDGEVLDKLGDPATQAGSRPHSAATEFFLSSAVDASGAEYAVEQIQDTIVDLPAGVIGNPRALETCTQAQLLGSANNCPNESQVGLVTVWFSGQFFGTPGNPLPYVVPLYNMERPEGTPSVPIGSPALLAFNVIGSRIQVYAKLRAGADYGVTMIAKNAPQTISVAGITFKVWGVPADPLNDAERYCVGGGGAKGCASADKDDPKPFFTLPTSCVGPVETFLEVTSWQDGLAGSSFLSHDNTEPDPVPIGAEGCNAVPFEPSIQARPTTNVADSPSGLDVDLHIPQNEDCDTAPAVSCEVATAHLRDATVSLPEGLVINPAGANGLDGCSLAEFGYTSTDPDGTIHTTADPATCPNASKLGTVAVETPLVDHPLQGSVHIADPHQNPFGSLLALYITIDDPKTATVVKLAGEVRADPQTGRLSSTFKQNPQLPFEDFRLHFFAGAGGSLRTPATCGTHTTTSELVPWTAPEGLPANPADSWQITQGPGGACVTSAAALPHSPSFDAGAVSPIAGAHSPFVVNLRRADGTQNFHSLSISPPPGLVAKLAGTETCPDSALAAAAQKSGNEEKGSPSCPAASRVGSAVASAGAGPAPYHAQGEAYLAGPYKGAPLSLAIVTPAVAGPFDLGTVIVRTALHVDPKTAQITAVSDPIPAILQGIPLDIRAVQIALDRPQFSLNPTSCDPMAVNGSLLSTLGQSAPLSSRFQLGECGRLGFKPKMTLALKGGTTRGKHPALTAILTPRPGDANITSLSVALPPSEFLDQANIGTVCTRVQWAADACPAGSIYGTVQVTTPLLDYPLAGNIYLRSSDNKLPDLVPDLRGPAHQPIRLESAGRTDTLKGGLRNSFEAIPDAPFSKLVVQLQGGPAKGLLVNSRNICQQAYRALVKATAHNGKQATLRPKVKASCKGKKRKGKRSARAAR